MHCISFDLMYEYGPVAIAANWWTDLLFVPVAGMSMTIKGIPVTVLNVNYHVDEEVFDVGLSIDRDGLALSSVGAPGCMPTAEEMAKHLDDAGFDIEVLDPEEDQTQSAKASKMPNA